MKVRFFLFLLLGGVSAIVACRSDEEPALLLLDKGDLSRIKERGEIRVVVPTLSEGCLPRKGIPAAAERELAQSFGDRLGVEVTFICTDDREVLLSMLEEGKGDLVAAQLTATTERKQRAAFTRPTATVSEWLVGAKGAENLPRNVDDLEGHEIHVRKSSSFAHTLERIAREKELDFQIVPVDESMDTEMIVFEVGVGKRPLTVADSIQLESIESFNTDIKRLFPLVEGQQIGWAMRKDNPDLLAAANVFITEHFMTGHRRELSTGDLDDIIERGALRVLTSNNAVNYFLYRGQQKGFDYEIAKMAAERLGVRLEMIVPPRFEQLMDWLMEGRGDVIAGSLTVTPERERVIDFSRPYLYVKEILVQATQSQNKLQALNDLEGQEIHVQKSSSYYRSLQELQKHYGPFSIVEAPEDLEIRNPLGLGGTRPHSVHGCRQLPPGRGAHVS